MTQSQIIKAKLIKKMDYRDILDEEIKELAREYRKVSHKEIDKKYKK